MALIKVYHLKHLMQSGVHYEDEEQDPKGMALFSYDLNLYCYSINKAVKNGSQIVSVANKSKF